MARLTDLRQSFTVLAWPDKVKFIEEYRTQRYNDLNTVQEFDLSKSKKTKSTKLREPKVKKEPKLMKVSADKLATMNPEQLNLLQQLGLA